MGKIAALDYGLKRIGIAFSDERKCMAFPAATVESSVESVAAALQGHKIETIVIGLPLLMNGKEGDMAAAVRAFAVKLEARVQIPIVFLDERLSSKQADASLRETSMNRKERDKRMDQVAAAHLLECYLARLNLL